MVEIPKIIALVRDASVVVGVGYSIKLYSVVLKAKEAEAALWKARAEHLEKLSVPALAEQMQKMAPLLNEYTKKNQELEQKERDFPEVVQQAARYSNTLAFRFRSWHPPSITASATLGLPSRRFCSLAARCRS